MHAIRAGLLVIGGALCIALATTGAAGAGGLFDTKVTIKANGGDFSGKVKSSQPQACADDRLVKVFRKRPGKDERIASDNASRQGNKYTWNTGNTGAGPGKYYAKARKTDACRGAKSKVVTVN